MTIVTRLRQTLPFAILRANCNLYGPTTRVCWALGGPAAGAGRRACLNGGWSPLGNDTKTQLVRPAGSA
eukprot:5767277-Lingulodinium_polyedra.AAC.1